MKARLRLALVLPSGAGGRGVAWTPLLLAIATKPAYCSNVSDLQSSVDTLKGVQLEKRRASPTRQTDLQNVQTDANAVVELGEGGSSRARPARWSRSVSSLAKTIEKPPSSPTAQQLAGLVPKINSTCDGWRRTFRRATSSACD